MDPRVITICELLEVRRLWVAMTDGQKQEVAEKVNRLRNECYRMAGSRGFPLLTFVGREEWYVVSQPAWEQFTRVANLDVVAEAMLELDDPLSQAVKPSKVTLFAWPDPSPDFSFA